MSSPTNLIPADRAAQLLEQYRASLFDDVIPWWMEHSLDPEYGGYYSLLERDGTPYGTDKYMWMNGRQVWMLSHLYNTSNPKNPNTSSEHKTKWLDAARLGADFMLDHAFKNDGKMHFRLTREGQSRSEVLSIYTEVFGALGMAELSKASGDEKYWTKAMEMYRFLMPRFLETTDTPLLGYPINAQFQTHGYHMCRVKVASAFNEIKPSETFESDISLSVESIIQRHWKPELDALLETISADGSTVLDLPEGRMLNPGHAIESAWMLMEVARKRGDDALFSTAVDIVLSSLNRSWDHEYGGMRYLLNIDGTPTHNIEADMKLWWPHNEALYALLQAWAYTGRQDVADWYEKIHSYTFQHFPDPEYGEWFGYLNRDGSRPWTAKANGWKGCFHLPRVLHRCHQLLSQGR